jgi:NodT family efflux transporter outer membrane factor (OMF) lipoprotein
MSAFRNCASLLAGSVGLALLAACATTSTKTTPETTVEARDRVRQMDAAGRWTRPDAATVVQPDWWQVFGDPQLSGLIQQAIADNIDLRILTYRIEQAELGVKSARQAGMPKFSADIGGNASFQKLGGLSSHTREYTTGVNVSWEADLWGKLRQQRAATQGEVRATESDWRAGYLLLVRDVASSYFQLRALDEQAEIETRALGWANEALKVYERQLASRLITRDVPAAQQAEVLRLQRELEELRRQRDIEVNNLAVLLGQMPGAFRLEPATLRGRVKLPTVDTGVSANLLERRPDVVAADERLSAAYRITEARRAARLPSITLGVSGGASAASLANPIAFFGNFVPRISFPALDPQTKIDVKLSEVDLKEARDRYTQTVLRAVQEAENAIIDLRSRQTQLDTERQRRELLERTMQDVDKRLKAGMATRLEALEASRSLLLTEQAELQLYSFALLDTVRLYNSLGGGW